MGEAGVNYAEVSDARAAQGGEVGARAEGSGEVVYEGSDVGATAAGDQELRRLPCRVEGGEFEAMYRDGTCFAFDADAAAVQIVEPYASTFEGRGHRRNLEEVSCKRGERIADGVRRVLTEPGFRETLRARGLARAADFSWDRSIRRIRQIYGEVAAEP